MIEWPYLEDKLQLAVVCQLSPFHFPFRPLSRSFTPPTIYYLIVFLFLSPLAITLASVLFVLSPGYNTSRVKVKVLRLPIILNKTPFRSSFVN